MRGCTHTAPGAAHAAGMQPGGAPHKGKRGWTKLLVHWELIRDIKVGGHSSFKQCGLVLLKNTGLVAW